MPDAVLILISLAVFAIFARFTDQSARALCCFIRGTALILASNCVLEAAGLSGISINLFTAPAAGVLGLPAVGLFVLMKIFF